MPTRSCRIQNRIFEIQSAIWEIPCAINQLQDAIRGIPSAIRQIRCEIHQVQCVIRLIQLWSFPKCTQQAQPQLCASQERRCPPTAEVLSTCPLEDRNQLLPVKGDLGKFSKTHCDVSRC